MVELSGSVTVVGTVAVLTLKTGGAVHAMNHHELLLINEVAGGAGIGS